MAATEGEVVIAVDNAKLRAPFPLGHGRPSKIEDISFLYTAVPSGDLFCACRLREGCVYVALQ